MKNSGLLFLSLFTTARLFAGAPADAAARLDRVEAGLLPPARLAGASDEAWTLPARMAHHHVPGLSLAVLDGHSIVATRAYGLARADRPAPATSDTLFQAGALSQTATALAALSLVDTGRLSLDTDVNAALTTWKLTANTALSISAGEAPVTLRQLLSHTAGLASRSAEGFAPGAPLPTLAQILDGVPPASGPALRLGKPPGSAWQFSASSYDVVQQLLLDVTGEPFADYLGTRVLAPAGLNASTFAQPLPTDLAPRAATGHDLDGRPIAGAARLYPELATAGLWTTAEDFARLLLGLDHALAGDAAAPGFSRASVAAMLAVPLPGSDFGLGLGVKNTGERLQLSHSGATDGFRAFFVYYPATGRGAVLLANSAGASALIPELLRALAREYDWPDFRVVEKTAVPFAPTAFDDFAGRYERDETVLVFYRKDNHFYLRATNTPRVEIFPKSDHQFFQLGSDVTYTFERDEILRVTHVVRSDPSPQLFRRTDPRTAE